MALAVGCLETEVFVDVNMAHLTKKIALLLFAIEILWWINRPRRNSSVINKGVYMFSNTIRYILKWVIINESHEKHFEEYFECNNSCVFSWKLSQLWVNRWIKSFALFWHNLARPNAFTDVAKFTIHTRLWYSEVAWYSPSATCLYSLNSSLRINGFKPFWTCLIVVFLQPKRHFFNLFVNVLWSMHEVIISLIPMLLCGRAFSCRRKTLPISMI